MQNKVYQPIRITVFNAVVVYFVFCSEILEQITDKCVIAIKTIAFVAVSLTTVQRPATLILQYCYGDTIYREYIMETPFPIVYANERQ